MTDIIFHHYAPSPVAEKVRTAFGVKQLTWHSVEHNRLPDRPELFAMTGGYRRIPVMQIGADIFCDSQCILRELETRHPEPSLFPNNGLGLPNALSRWTDGTMFNLAAQIAFVPEAHKGALPEALLADRARLLLGPDRRFADEIDNVPHLLAQLRAQLGWLEDRLSTGRKFILADDPGMPDLLAWYIVWFVQGRHEDAESFFQEFAFINAWAERMRAVGHGSPQEMSATRSLEIARNASTTTPGRTDPRDPQKLNAGESVAIHPMADTGETPVTGVVHATDRETITIVRTHPDCGEVAVHFPRVGYKVVRV